MTPELRAGAALDRDGYTELTQRAVFDCCKWTLSSHDTPTIARFPLLMPRAHYRALAEVAEKLAAEALQAELELLGRPELWPGLGLPEPLVAALKGTRPSEAPRFLRVDFHPTADGYRITEANTDVAGGFIEATGLSRVWQRLGAGATAGDPLAALAAEWRARHGARASVGLMHLPRYVDDRQLVAFFARELERAGLEPVMFDAAQRWPEEVDAVFRYFPAEWLPNLSAAIDWRPLVRSSSASNPVSAILTASKRFPLVWPRLETSVETWRRWMPRTAEPGPGAEDDPSVVLKPALGNEGTHVCIEGVSTTAQRKVIAAQARRAPSQWAAQERFDSQPLDTPDGPRHGCAGIYVVAGRAVGAYGRLSPAPLIGADAQDAVVLLEDR